MKITKNLAFFAALWMFATPSVVAQNPAPSSPDKKILEAIAKVDSKNIQINVEKLAGFGSRHTLGVNIPASSGRGVVAAREYVKQQFESYSKACGGCLEVKTYTFTEPASARIPQPTELVDVYAVLKGSNPESARRLIIISGHYDTISMAKMLDPEAPSPGANDDGSGTAVVLEAARVLSQHRFPATIVFAAFDAEEQGLFGAKGFAKMAKLEGWNVEAVLNNDIVGGDKTQDQQGNVRVFSEGLPLAAPDDWKRVRMMGAESDSPSRELARYITETAREYLPGKTELQPRMIFRQDRFLRGGDHLGFNEQGFTAVRITEWRENFAHQHQLPRTENGIEYGDLPKFVDYGYMAGVTRLNVATAASLASAPAPPADPKLLTKTLENDTNLVWQPSPDGRAASYEVIYRDTTAPNWEKTFPVSGATKATIPVSKDNGIFAVRAVDAEGHRSLPALPIPER